MKLIIDTKSSRAVAMKCINLTKCTEENIKAVKKEVGLELRVEKNCQFLLELQVENCMFKIHFFLMRGKVNLGRA